ncbi:MAG: hypothetical protein JXA82_07680 [Sedimentisphaerales bacterium]|nr:hypothetical protein [Sedimentisphaerales bacterium]
MQTNVGGLFGCIQGGKIKSCHATGCQIGES